MRGIKRQNEYAEILFANGLYDSMPKSVLAAVAVGLAAQLEGMENARIKIIKEWAVLYANGIVPQEPFKK